MTTSSKHHPSLDNIKGHRWLEISLTVDSETAEVVAEVLGRFIPAGVAIESVSDANIPSYESTPELEQRGKLQLRSFLAVDDDLDRTLRKIERELWPLEMIARQSGLEPPTPQYRPIADTDWAAQWKNRYRPLRAGNRLVIIPTWMHPKLAPNDIPVLIDPGQAFGTGVHPTTQLCLTAIEKYLLPGESVLDLGCGSGILAIAALKLGASHVTGCDSDPHAIRAARKNARANDVADQMLLILGSLAGIRRQNNYGLVVANILSRPIIRLLRDGLTQTVAPGGIMILAGILAEQEPEVLAAVHTTGMALLATETSSDIGSAASNWVALIASAQ